MRVSVVGTGYVGLVAGTCFSDVGNHVICVDNVRSKIDALLDDRIPIYEPGLSEMVKRNAAAGRLEFTTDLSYAVANSLIIFLAVGTPQGDDGDADLSALLSVAAEIGRLMDGYRIIVTKSTVPVGTHQRVINIIQAETDHPFDYVSNPEFMKEGAAIDDFMKPDRAVIGTTNPAVVEIMKQLYSPFMRKQERILVMDPASAEMVKYAANVMLATKISLMNEVATLCEHFGANVETVRQGVGSDCRIGNAFLFPGVGYGGSCFPKDVNAFIHMGLATGKPALVAQAVHDRNQEQRRRFARRIIDYFGDQANDVTLGVWGLAFKGQTDDIRESPAIDSIRMFIEAGMTIRAHDPEAIENAKTEIGGDRASYYSDGYEALEDADAMVVFTDWQEFRTPDFDLILRKLKRPLIFDGRNLYNPIPLGNMGFEYHSIGRPTKKPAKVGD